MLLQMPSFANNFNDCNKSGYVGVLQQMADLSRTRSARRRRDRQPVNSYFNQYVTAETNYPVVPVEARPRSFAALGNEHDSADDACAPLIRGIEPVRLNRVSES